MIYSRLARHALAPAATASVTLFATSGTADTSAIMTNRAARYALSHLGRGGNANRVRSLATTTAKAETATLKMPTPTPAKAATPPPASTTVATTKTSSSTTLMEWYEKHLSERPVWTKMVTGSVLWGLGDGVAQVVPTLSAGEPLEPYDWPRTARAVFFGFAIHAPTSHVHFNLLEYMTHRAGVTGLGIPVFKAFMEQFVYWSWISNSLYHGAMGAMQGMSPSQCVDRIKDLLWETQKAQWVFWIPVQLLNFRYVPVRHQLNVVLVTSIVWTALLSMWYPPEKKEEEKVQLAAAQS